MGYLNQGRRSSLLTHGVVWLHPFLLMGRESQPEEDLSQVIFENRKCCHSSNKWGAKKRGAKELEVKVSNINERYFVLFPLGGCSSTVSLSSKTQLSLNKI